MSVCPEFVFLLIPVTLWDEAGLQASVAFPQLYIVVGDYSFVFTTSKDTNIIASVSNGRSLDPLESVFLDPGFVFLLIFFAF